MVPSEVASRPFHRRAPQPTSPEVAELLSKYVSATPPRQLNLSALLSFGHPLTSESILASVGYVLSEIPRRLATRVRSLEALPFIVGTNPYVANTLKAYRESFRWLATYPAVTNLVENAKFVEQLEELVQSHANDIPTMAKGYVRDYFLIFSVADGLPQVSRNVHGTCPHLKSIVFWMLPYETVSPCD
jgi:26S proteasome regulatory subunit T1